MTAMERRLDDRIDSVANIGYFFGVALYDFSRSFKGEGNFKMLSIAWPETGKLL